jgi:hypothetical protein
MYYPIKIEKKIKTNTNHTPPPPEKEKEKEKFIIKVRLICKTPRARSDLAAKHQGSVRFHHKIKKLTKKK